MKKFFVSVMSCLLTVVTYAQSTCETRVDAHQKATTRERVTYCLTPDATAVNDSYAGLVFSGVSSHEPQVVQTKQERPTAKPGHYDVEDMTVSRIYVATNQFPQATQSNAGQAVEPTPMVVSVGTPQPIIQPVVVELVPVNGAVSNTPTATYNVLVPGDEFVYVTSPTVPLSEKARIAQANSLQSVSNSMTEPNAPIESWQQVVVETKAGTKARQNKPERRHFKQTIIEEKWTEQPVQTIGQTESSVQPVDATNLYTEQTDLSSSNVSDTLGTYNPYEVPVEETTTYN